jgi:thioredoxin-related protein
MKKFKYSIISTFMLITCGLFINTSVLGQQTGFSGLWVIGNRSVIAGSDYANAMPKRIKIAERRDSIKIEKTTLDEKGEVLIKESLNLHNNPVTGTTPNGRIKSQRASWLQVGKCLIVETTLTKQNVKAIIETKINDTLTISTDQRILTLVRRSRSVNGNNENDYVLKGEYDRIDSGEVASGTGIRFEQNLTWNAVLAKARQENKYIFLDCYASWCGPCKLMDNNVYTAFRVGDYANDHFISVRLQMDKTPKDNEQLRSLYGIVDSIQAVYKVNVFPTFLFLSPSGTIVHRSLGYLDPIAFLDLLKDATDTSKQYYTLMAKYQGGADLNPSALKFLAEINFVNGDEAIANKVAEDYKKNYLNKLSEPHLLIRENFEFLNEFEKLDNSNDLFFQVCYAHPHEVDSLLNFPGLANSIVEKVITWEEVYDNILRNRNFGFPVVDNPNWAQMINTVQYKYPKVNADLMILHCQLQWYQSPKRQNWHVAVNTVVKIVNKFGVKALGPAPDNVITDIITMHSNDRAVLNRALKWLDTISRTTWKYGTYGNYAGVLYKLGRKEDAKVYLKKYISVMKAANTREQLNRDQAYLAKIKILKRINRGDALDETWGSVNFH